MDVTIRRATLADAPELARLRWEFRPEDQQAQRLEEFSRDFQAWLSEALDSRTWMAAVADAGPAGLVGCVFLRSVSKVPNPGALDRAWGYVTNSYVVPSHRGRGLGGGLLEIVIATAREWKHELLIVWPSREAVSLYTRAGFREATEAHAGPDDYPPLELVLS
jgi:GNAT superfamily N-acetyltransferase